MNGILVVNHFLNGEKFNKLHSHLIKSAEKEGIKLTLKTNLELAASDDKADFVLFWDKDVNLAKSLEKKGLKVFNSSEAIRKCDNKAETYIELSGIVNQPKTLISPLVFFKSDLSEFVDKAVEILGLPLVFKECYGSFGAQVFLCTSRQEIISHISERPFILQQFIKEACGRDLRLEVVGGSVVCAIARENKNDFRANITNGGTAAEYIPTEKQCEIAVSACRALGLDFGGVDIMCDDIVCEVNSNAHIMNIMKCTGVDTAPLIFREILSRL